MDRRTALKVGAGTAALAWVKPTVSSATVQAAKHSAPPCDTYYRCKIENGGNKENKDNAGCTSGTFLDGCDYVDVVKAENGHHKYLIPASAQDITVYNKSGPNCFEGNRNAQTTITDYNGSKKLVNIEADDISHIVITFCLP